jgi:3'-phosphoadenosine 5'-phosphosulfate sulfotransferase
MSELTYSGFIGYIKSQDPSKEVDHHSWGDCAVGDYMRDTLTVEELCRLIEEAKDRFRLWIGNDLDYRAQEFVQQHLRENNKGLYEVLNHKPTAIMYPTYGHLQDFLLKQEGYEAEFKVRFP